MISMLKKIKISNKVICGALLLVIALCVIYIFLISGEDYQPGFIITGDVEQVLNVQSLKGYQVHTVEKKRCLMLSEMVALAVPCDTRYKVVLKGSDGFMAQVDSQQLEGMYITYTADNEWEMINLYHSPSSNVKHLTEVWVVAEGTVEGLSVNVITPDENVVSYTPGQFFMSENKIAPVLQGKSEKTSSAGTFKAAVYTQRLYKNVKDIYPQALDVLVMGEEGRYAYDSSPGSIAFSGNRLSYIFSDGRTTMDKVRGILVNPPPGSIMDVYAETVNNVQNGGRVLVVIVDGFGYHQYVYAVENGYAPYLSALNSARQATSVYQPVTYAGLAAMFTGQPPDVNGVYQRDMADLKTPDIFEYVTGIGKSAAYIEGDIKILNTSLTPELNADRNANGSTDDEVYAAALSEVTSDTDLIVVHFHGVDDAGHGYGDVNAETMQKVAEIDGYIENLAMNFRGRIIVTADHGMHGTEDGGSHGVFRYEDMIVPYISSITESRIQGD